MTDQNNANKNSSLSKKAADPTNNHHANPSAISPEVEALRTVDHVNKNGSKLHDSLNQDKRAAAREVHTNGSTPRGDQ